MLLARIKHLLEKPVTFDTALGFAAINFLACSMMIDVHDNESDPYTVMGAKLFAFYFGVNGIRRVYQAGVLWADQPAAATPAMNGQAAMAAPATPAPEVDGQAATAAPVLVTKAAGSATGDSNPAVRKKKQ